MRDALWFAATFFPHIWRPVAVQMVRDLLGSAGIATTLGQGVSARGSSAARRGLGSRRPLVFR